MISKQANNRDFGNEMFAEMDRVLTENYAHVRDITKEPEPVLQSTALSDLVGALVRSAVKLEETGHPARAKVDGVLHYIQTNMIGKAAELTGEDLKQHLSEAKDVFQDWMDMIEQTKQELLESEGPGDVEMAQELSEEAESLRPQIELPN